MNFLSVLHILFITVFFSGPLLFSQTSVEPVLAERSFYKDYSEHLVFESLVDYPSFNELTDKVYKYRAKRLITLDTFFEYSADPNTIILDTRSVSAYNGRHIDGAINLPFSDFTKDALKKIIGDKDKRVLIYCNNNFKNDPVNMRAKAPPLALNIPTFINLYGYDYKNVYELKELIDVNDERIRSKWNIELNSRFKNLKRQKLQGK